MAKTRTPRRDWTPEEDAALTYAVEIDQLPAKQIAVRLGRPESSVQARMFTLNLRLRASTAASVIKKQSLDFARAGQAVLLRNQVPLRGDVPQSRPTAFAVCGVSPKTLASGARAPFVLLAGNRP